MSRPKKNRKNARPKRMTTQSLFPDIDTNPTFVRTFRFSSANAETKGADVVTGNSLLNLMLMAQNTLSTVAAQRYFSAVRLKKLSVYGVASANPTALTTISLEWNGYKSPNRTINAIGDNAVPAVISMRPPKNSAAAMWFNSDPLSSGTDFGEPVFSVTAQAGAIIDLQLAFQVADVEPAEPAYPLQFMATLPPPGGFPYLFCNRLDNTSVTLGAGVGNWFPVGVSAICWCYG